jgi:hypothetical protein
LPFVPPYHIHVLLKLLSLFLTKNIIV